MKKDTFPWIDGRTPEEHTMLEFAIELALNPEINSVSLPENPFKKHDHDIDKIADYILGKEKLADRESITFSVMQEEYSAKRKSAKKRDIDGRAPDKNNPSLKK